MYSYHDAMFDDVKQAIEEGYNLTEWKGDRDGLEEKLQDDLWIDDSVTGNASGSYTFNTATAKEYFFEDPEAEDYFVDAISEFCTDAVTVARHVTDWEWIDVTIRCYLLGQIIHEVLDEMEEEGRFDEGDGE